MVVANILMREILQLTEWEDFKGLMRRKLPHRQKAAYELEHTALAAKREQELPLEAISSIEA